MVWATWEHDANDPDCLDPQTAPAAGWSFTSASCAECLATSTTGTLACPDCDFNTGDPSSDTKLMDTPTEICRVYADGTGPGDTEAQENIDDVDDLNDQLVGPDGILTELADTDPMSVWKNYFNVGGLWLNDPNTAATTDNQRGSIQLANTTMETIHQGTFQDNGGELTRTTATNCFVCHTYTAGSTTTSNLSHIFDEIDGGS